MKLAKLLNVMNDASVIRLFRASEQGNYAPTFIATTTPLGIKMHHLECINSKVDNIRPAGHIFEIIIR